MDLTIYVYTAPYIIQVIVSDKWCLQSPNIPFPRIWLTADNQPDF
jgi:hypothetical protein